MNFVTFNYYFFVERTYYVYKYINGKVDDHLISGRKSRAEIVSKSRI